MTVVHEDNCVQDPKLPLELEREIFESVALESQSDLRTLRLVAHRIRNWLSPMFYELVICRNAGDPVMLPKADARYVQHLFLTYEVGYGVPGALEYLSHCHNVQNLALWFDPPRKCLSILTSLLHSPLRRPSTPLLRLSVKLSGVFGSAGALDAPVHVDFNCPVLKDLTHLDVLDYHGPVCTQWEKRNNFGCLKELRYLSFNYGMRVSLLLLDNILRECKKLEVLALIGIRDYKLFMYIFSEWRRARRKMEGNWGDTDWYHGMPISERALEARAQENKIMGLDTKPAWWVNDWKAGAVGKEDFWESAKKMVAERRRKDKDQTRDEVP